MEYSLICFWIIHILDYSLLNVNRLFSNCKIILKGEDILIYERVVEYCKKNGLTIYKFETMCNLGNGTVGRWKDGSSYPSLQTLNKIVEATGIPIEHWIGGKKA